MWGRVHGFTVERKTKLRNETNKQNVLKGQKPSKAKPLFLWHHFLQM